MKYWGATVGIPIYVEAETKDEAAREILIQAREYHNDAWIIELELEDELEDEGI